MISIHIRKEFNTDTYWQLNVDTDTVRAIQLNLRITWHVVRTFVYSGIYYD